MADKDFFKERETTLGTIAVGDQHDLPKALLAELNAPAAGLGVHGAPKMTYGYGGGSFAREPDL